MRLGGAAFAAVFLVTVEAHAETQIQPPEVYHSISIQQMATILEAHGAKATETQVDGKMIVIADTPVGSMEVWFADCAEGPNPCGYYLVKRYRGLALSPKALNMFNQRMAFGFAFRKDGSDDVLLAYPVALRNGMSEDSIAATFSVPTGLTDVFQAFLTDTLHLKPENIHTP